MSAPLTPEHRHQLRRFARLVYDMYHCRFMVNYLSKSQVIGHRTDGDGNEHVTHPDWDKEDFMAFLTRYRQVGLAKRDPVSLEKVLETIDLYADDALKAKTGEVRSKTLPFMQGKWVGLRFGRMDSEAGPGTHVTGIQTLQTLVNGDYFHSDEKCAGTLAFLESEGVEFWMYIWPVMREIVLPTLEGCLYLCHALRQHAILADEDFGPAWFKATTTTEGAAGS